MADNMQFTPTPIGNINQVIPLNSPLHVNLSGSSAFTHVRLKLWYWTGDLTAPFDNSDLPNIILYKEKVSTSDTGIVFEVADYVKDSFSPLFTYHSSSTPTISDMGVYFKYEYETFYNPNNLPTASALEISSSNTYFGTQGWNWNYEGYTNVDENNMSFGFYESTLPVKPRDPSIVYYNEEFNLSSVTSSFDMIIQSHLTSSSTPVCPKEPFLIVYLDKRGLWDYLTLSGKVTFSTTVDKEDYTRTFRNPLNFNNSLNHQTKQYNTNVTTKINVNTGLLNEGSGQYIEEIIYSPKVYLLEFKKLPLNASNFYNNYITRPVIVTNSDFLRKTRLNDKGKISYNIQFEETTNKLRNIR